MMCKLYLRLIISAPYPNKTRTLKVYKFNFSLTSPAHLFYFTVNQNSILISVCSWFTAFAPIANI